MHRGSEGQTTREAMVSRAAELFAANGYANTSLSEIAEAVGIRKASLYHYIQSKEDLLLEINVILTEELVSEADRLMADATTPDAKLRAFLRAFMRLVAARRLEMTVFISERHAVGSNPSRWREVVERRTAWQQVLRDIVAEGVADGSFRNVPVAVTTMGILGMLSIPHLWYRPDGPLGPDEVADTFAALILRGIAA